MNTVNCRNIGSFHNALYRQTRDLAKPYIGMGGTRILWSDRIPVTVVKVSKSMRSIWVSRDQAKQVGDYFGNQEYVIIPSDWNDPKIVESAQEYTLRKHGKYVRKGQPLTGEHLLLGDRLAYEDPSF